MWIGGLDTFKIRLHPQPTAVAEESIAAGGVMDVNTALQETLKTALGHNGLVWGIHEAAKALDKRQAHLLSSHIQLWRTSVHQVGGIALC